jgi:hypothetical protein
MKARVLRNGRAWVVSAVFLAGLMYSVLAFNAKPVYASSCDSDTELGDADAYCQAIGEVAVANGTFECFPNQGFAVFYCEVESTSNVFFPVLTRVIPSLMSAGF